MTSESIVSTSYNSVWTTPSDLWVVLNPDVNPWTEEIDWSIGMLFRRATVRSSKTELRALLLAAPEGMPSRRVLVLPHMRGTDGEWLSELAPIVEGLKIGSATVFAPSDWRAPTARAISAVSKGKWGLRWVEAAG